MRVAHFFRGAQVPLRAVEGALAFTNFIQDVDWHGKGESRRGASTGTRGRVRCPIL